MRFVRFQTPMRYDEHAYGVSGALARMHAAVLA